MIRTVDNNRAKWEKTMEAYFDNAATTRVADEVKEKLEIIPVKKVKDVLKRLGL